MLVSAGLVSHSHQRLVEVGYLIEPDQIDLLGRSRFLQGRDTQCFVNNRKQ